MEIRERLQRLPRRLLQLVVLHFSPPAASPYRPPLLKERRQLLRYRLLQWQQHAQQQLLRPWPPRLFPSLTDASPSIPWAAGGRSKQRQLPHQREGGAKTTSNSGKAEGVVRAAETPGAAADPATPAGEVGETLSPAALSSLRETEEIAETSSGRTAGRRKWRLLRANSENFTASCSSDLDGSSNSAVDSSSGNDSGVRARWGRSNGRGLGGGGITAFVGGPDETSSGPKAQQQEFFSNFFPFVPLHWKAPSLWPAHCPLPPAPPPPARVDSQGPAAASPHLATAVSPCRIPADASHGPLSEHSSHSPPDATAVSFAARDGAPVTSPAAAVSASAAAATASVLRVHPMGHGTFLLQCCGMNILTDPILSSHAGPWGRVGVPRVSQAAATLSSLPPIDAILISSLRYDAYDYSTVRELCKRDGSTLFVPEGAYARRYFSPKVFGSVYPMQWGDRVMFDNLTVCFTPAIHAAVGRYLWDYGVPACGGFILQWTTHAPCGGLHAGFGGVDILPHSCSARTPEDSCYVGQVVEDRWATSHIGRPREGVCLPHAEQQREQQHIQEQQQRLRQQDTQQQSQRGQQQYTIGQKTVYYAGRTAYSGRLFDMVRDAAARDRENLATQAQQETEWRVRAWQQHERYMLQSTSTQKQEDLLLLPFSSTSPGAARRPEQQQRQGNPRPQRTQEERHRHRTHPDPLQKQEKDQQHPQQRHTLVKGKNDNFVFDVSILPIGGYEPRPYMQRYHMTPEEAVEAHLRLRSRVSVASHFDVFPVGSEAFGEAPQRMRVHCKKQSISTCYEGSDQEASTSTSLASSMGDAGPVARTAGGSLPVEGDAARTLQRDAWSCGGVHVPSSRMSRGSSYVCSSGSSSLTGSGTANGSLINSSRTETNACAVKDRAVGASTVKLSTATAAAAEHPKEKLLGGGAASDIDTRYAAAACTAAGEQQGGSSSIPEDETLKKLGGRERHKENGAMLALRPGEYILV